MIKSDQWTKPYEKEVAPRHPPEEYGGKNEGGPFPPTPGGWGAGGKREKREQRTEPTGEEVAESSACRAIALKRLGLWQWWRERHAEFDIAIYI